MGFPVELMDGFWLAATVAEDPDGTAASAGLRGPLRAESERHLSGLAALDRAERETRVRNVASGLRPSLRGTESIPPRARALLAREVSRSQGAVWLRDAPRPRPGYAASPALRATLRALAASEPPGRDTATPGKERGEGRRALAAALSVVEGDHRAGLLAILDEQEAGAVLALEPLMVGAAATPRAEVLFAMLAATRSSVTPEERTRMLGAMCLGFRGEMDGDARSGSWRRAGAELREMECPE